MLRSEAPLSARESRRYVLAGIHERRRARLAAVVYGLIAIGIVIGFCRWRESVSAVFAYGMLVVAGGSSAWACAGLAWRSRRLPLWTVEADDARLHVCRDRVPVFTAAFPSISELHGEVREFRDAQGSLDYTDVVEARLSDGTRWPLSFLNERRLRRVERRIGHLGLPVRCSYSRTEPAPKPQAR